MTEFIGFLRDFIRVEFTGRVEESTGQLRAFFSGPPQSHLEELFIALVGEEQRFVIQAKGENIIVPVFLVDSKAVDPFDHSYAARCTPNYLTQIRNSSEKITLALRDLSEPTNASLETAGLPLGIKHEIRDVDTWMNSGLVNGLIKRSIQRYAFDEKVSKKADVAMRYMLTEAWEVDERHGDKRSCWEILQTVANAEITEVDSHLVFSAALGLPSCKLDQLGSDQQLKFGRRFLDFTESRGINSTFKELVELEPDLEISLNELRKHLREKDVSDTGELVKIGMSVYRPDFNKLENSDSSYWWFELTTEVWSKLLDATDQPETVLQLNLELADPIGVLNGNLPNLTGKEVRLIISRPEGAVSDRVGLTVSRSNGTSKFEEICNLTLDENSVEAVDDMPPKHARQLRYKVEASGFEDVIIKVIALDFYIPGVIASARSASKCKLFTTRKKSKKNDSTATKSLESELQVSGIGQHHLDIFSAREIELSSTISSKDNDSEQLDGSDRPINYIDDYRSTCLIETDESSTHDFTGTFSSEITQYRVHVLASEDDPDSVASEFDRLVSMHRLSSSRSKESGSFAARVNANNSITQKLELWAIEDSESYNPLAMGPDLLDHLIPPKYVERHKFSGCTLLSDPRPKEPLDPPEKFLIARNQIRLKLLGVDTEQIQPVGVQRLHELMRDEEFVQSVGDLLDAYTSWLNEDYEKAVWSDLVCIHSLQSNGRSLAAIPYAILLSPLHPVRIAWQCRAQKMLQDALDYNSPCPAASTLDPSSFPDCLILPCKQANGSPEDRPYVSVRSSSDYWGVMWQKDEFDRLLTVEADGLFGAGFGIHVEGLTSGFTSQQVVRSLDEVSKLRSGRSRLQVRIISDTESASNCSEGVKNWCLDNLGPDEDPWFDSGRRELTVLDTRKRSLIPEQADLASLADKVSNSVHWYCQQGNQEAHVSDDLSIIAHLATINWELSENGIRSALDPTGLTRWRIRRQLPEQDAVLVAESRIGVKPSDTDPDSLTGKILACVDQLESPCSRIFDSYVFAPDLTTLSKCVERSQYTAISASNIDAACFFGSTDKLYLWDYELPPYTKRAGENGGFFLLATQSATMVESVRKAVTTLGRKEDISEDIVCSLLEEVSRRGIPTLKKLTAGGRMSLGELGMLIAMRILQSDFNEGSENEGLIPAKSNHVINIIVPADPFQNQFDDLRKALAIVDAKRPDLIVLSIRFSSGDPTSLKITPIEVKARTGILNRSGQASALKQTVQFSSLLEQMRSRAESVEIWQLGFRSVIAALLDYGFRVYGQLEKFMGGKAWAREHESTLHALANGSLDIEIDNRGRLIGVHQDSSSQLSDSDDDGFKESLLITHADACEILFTSSPKFVINAKQSIGDWELEPVQPNVIYERDTNQEDADSATKPIDINLGNIDEKNSVENENTKKPEPNSTDMENVDSEGIKFDVGVTIGEFNTDTVNFFPGNTALNQLNVGIVGDLGTGKTQLVQALVYQLCSSTEQNRGVAPNMLIFDYKRDYSKSEFVEATNAKVIDPFDMPLNLFDRKDSSNPKRAWLERSKFFADILNKIYGGIGPKQKENIKVAIKKAYENSDLNGLPDPTIKDVFESYKNEMKGPIDSPYSIMSDMVDGAYFSEESNNIQSFSSFLNGVVVIDLASIGQDDATKNMIVVVFLNLFYEYMLKIEKKPFGGADGQRRFVDTMVLVDEADNIMRFEFDVLKKILLQGREFGVGVLLASQYLSHFKTAHENYAEPLLTWFVHKVPNLDVKALQTIGLVNATNDKVQQVKGLECHECLYKTFDVDGKVIRGNPFFEIKE